MEEMSGYSARRSVYIERNGQAVAIANGHLYAPTIETCRSSEDIMLIRSAASRAMKAGPADSFTGTVILDALVGAEPPARLNANEVTFAPGARTVWHTHRVRQVLVVTRGAGIVQIKGEAPQRLKQGDVAVVPPDVVHWHGAAADSLMAHISLLEGGAEDTAWLQAVDDADYQAANAALRSA
jgi:quercetin dioxygenase-like cupin family protein